MRLRINKTWYKQYKVMIWFGLLVGVLSTLSGCGMSIYEVTEAEVTKDPVGQFVIEKEDVIDINDVNLRDNTSIYQQDDEGSVVTMYLTVRRGNKADATDHTWAEVNNYSIYDYQLSNETRYGVEAIFQVGDENGPIPGELGYSAVVPNATVRIRGATTSRNQQKSYKIKLMENAGRWREQRTIALNKHVFDSTRMRNKLSFDYIKETPGMIGLRTQFVHLYVKDETEGSRDSKFVDYGLYTQVEQPNTRYLRNHGLDSNGHLYKATSFEFYRYEDAIRLKTDPLYDDAAFQRTLEIKGNEDHTKVIEMLDAVNNYGLPIEEVFPYYFNEENYFTWMAFTILTGNIDTQTQNYYLYSPNNSHTWYFIPWDYDTALSRYEDEHYDQVEDNGYAVGVTNYWGVVLHKRVLAMPKYRKMLDDKIHELLKVMTPEKTKVMVDTYRNVVEQYAFRMPDLMSLPVTPEQWDDICRELPMEIERNYKLYLDSLEMPMPFFLYNTELDGDGIKFTWETAYDLDSENITYRFELSDTYLFKDKLVDVDGLMLPDYTTDMLEPGQYFYRVTATNESGYKQKAFNYYVDTDYIKHFGIICFYVTEDGGVELGGVTENEY